VKQLSGFYCQRSVAFKFTPIKPSGVRGLPSKPGDNRGTQGYSASDSLTQGLIDKAVRVFKAIEVLCCRY